MVSAEIIAVGSELLGPVRLDTNSLYLTRELNALGIPLVRKQVLGDELEGLAQAIRECAGRSALTLLTGGLGPTEDDRTREAAAAALRRPLRRDAARVSQLRRYFAERQRAMPEANLRQADRIEGADWLPNPIGSAPGQWCPHEDGVLVLLPGPSEEMKVVFEREVRPRLAAWAPRRAVSRRTLRVAGMPESEVDALVAPLYRGVSNPETTILAAGPGLVELHVVAWAENTEEADTMAERMARAMEARLGTQVYSHDHATLADVVGKWLRERGETVAVAESCTGGMVGEWLTRSPGASDYFAGGALCYANGVKEALAGVGAETLRVHGAVSEAVAREMAEHIRIRCGTEWGMAVTGIAGPGGGTPAKPVGTVWIAIAGPGESETHLHTFAGGGRDRVRKLSAVAALDHLRRALLLRLAPPTL